MQIALVVGTAVATVKHASMRRAKLLVVQPLAADGATPDGNPLLAVDELGAGKNDRVMLTSDGVEAQKMLGDDRTPVRYSVMGICDE